MAQSFNCPNCHASLKYDDRQRPLTVECEYCNSTVIVPDALRGSQSAPAATLGEMEQAQVIADVTRLVQQGKKIEAIKRFREAYATGLKEAKDVVDALEGGNTVFLNSGEFSFGDGYYETAVAQQQRGCRTATLISVAVMLLLIGIGAYFAISMANVGQQMQGVVEEVQEQVREEPGIPLPTATAVPQALVELFSFGGQEGIGPGFFDDTRWIATDRAGHIYTADYSGGRVQVFDGEGTFVTQWNAGEDLYMQGFTVDPEGTAYVAMARSVEMFNGMTGEPLGTLAGSFDARFETLTTAANGTIIAMGKNRLTQYDLNGNIVRDWPDAFSAISDFQTTYEAVAIDGAGNFYVLGNETVYKLDANGQFVNRIGSKGDAADQFRTPPTALAVDGQGNVYVNSFTGIKIYDANGRYRDTVELSGVIFDMLFTTENQLLAMNRNNNTVVKYALNLDN